MAEISPRLIADLRIKTGCSKKACTQALTDVNENFDEAVKLLRERRFAKMDEKAERAARVNSFVNLTTPPLLREDKK